MLTFDNLSVAPLFEHLNFTVEPGQFVAVLGPNGVGKSTLLGAILGTRHATGGRVLCDGTIGYIPQQRMFSPDLPLRARDLVDLAITNSSTRGKKLSRSERKQQTAALLARVGATQLADARVGTLSGGQQQLVRQAQALANNPDVLLCDEPLLSLDMGMQARLMQLLSELRAQGTAIIFVTHSINPIMSITDRVLYLAPQGHVYGSVDDVMTTETLSKLYESPVEVVRVGQRLVVL